VFKRKREGEKEFSFSDESEELICKMEEDYLPPKCKSKSSNSHEEEKTNSSPTNDPKNNDQHTISTE
jgi:hypothetical protein